MKGAPAVGETPIRTCVCETERGDLHENPLCKDHVSTVCDEGEIIWNEHDEWQISPRMILCKIVERCSLHILVIEVFALVPPMNSTMTLPK